MLRMDGVNGDEGKKRAVYLFPKSKNKPNVVQKPFLKSSGRRMISL